MTEKIILLGDLHIGARNDSEYFKEHQRKYFEEFFFPFVEENSISTIIQLGDLFDKRKTQNTKTLADARSFLFNPLKEKGISFLTFLGNHDVYYNNRNSVNTPTEVLSGRYDNIFVYTEPTEITIGNTKFALIPWINKENESSSLSFISNTTADVILGHFEISGFKMMKGGMECEEGLSQKTFDPFSYTFSGHFHHPAKNGNIIYIGSAQEITWSDAEDEKGFVLFDTKKSEYEWIPSPLFLHKKIFYDDTELTEDVIDNMDFSCYDNKKVKVIVKNKENDRLFDYFLSHLNSTFELQIADSSSYHSNILNDVENTEDTLTIIKRNVSAVSDNRIDSKKLEKMTESIYFEALNFSGE